MGETRRVVGIGKELQRGGTVLEGAARRDPKHLGGPPAIVGTEHLDELVRRPDVRRALDAPPVDLGVGVERRGESALGRA